MRVEGDMGKEDEREKDYFNIFRTRKKEFILISLRRERKSLF